MSNTPELLTPAELAMRWEVTIRSLSDQRKEGKGPQFIVLGERTVRYRLADVIAHEERMIAGGQIPVRAEEVMRKAASVLDNVARWKLRPATLTVVERTRDALLAQLDAQPKPPTTEAA
jgi:hypothetical protein